MKIICLLIFNTFLSAGLSHAGGVAQVDAQRLLAAPYNGNDWLSYGRAYNEQRFSPLTNINEKNVNKLHMDWYADIHSEDGLVSTPIVVDGIIYLSGAFARVFALDGKSGQKIWSYDPQVNRGASVDSSWSVRVNHGVAVYKGRVYVGTGDCRLIALDAASGKEVWSIESCGAVGGAGITGAPRVVNGMVLIGHGGAGVRGYVSAYDSNNGKLIWRFYTVPRGPKHKFEQPELKVAANTWHGHKWWQGAGGTVRNAITYDQELNRIYLGTAGSYPTMAGLRDPEGGDNLYTESIVALDADTGKYIWHYQQVPHDTWGYNATADIVLADLTLEGKSRKVLMQAPKNGFFYVLDRQTGELLSANNYARVTWAKGIDMKTGRPIEHPEARYYNRPDLKATVYPNIGGAHSWQPMSFNPKTGLVYLPVQDFPTIYSVDAEYGLTFKPLPDQIKLKGRLVAWDPVTQSERWRVDHDLALNGGTLATAGDLVFQGTATGELRAYSAQKGELLWSSQLGSSMQAAPITYAIDGQQYILAPVGLGGEGRMTHADQAAGPNALGPSRLIAYSLGKQHASLPVNNQPPQVPRPPKGDADPAVIAHGAKLYSAMGCYFCHGENAVGMAGGSIPDLRYMSANTHVEWPAVVLGGSRKDKGMMPFYRYLEHGDSEAIHSFVIEQARKLYNKKAGLLGAGSLLGH